MGKDSHNSETGLTGKSCANVTVTIATSPPESKKCGKASKTGAAELQLAPLRGVPADEHC